MLALSANAGRDERRPLLLFPTALERQGFDEVGGLGASPMISDICGFGPVAAGARTSQLLSRTQAAHVILVGIAGSYDEPRLPVGAATAFDQVVLDGIGVGQGRAFRGPAALGFAQWPGSPDTCQRPVDDRLSLEPLDAPQTGDSPRLLVTVCATSSSLSEADTRRAAYPHALAEDMEAFGVALACALHRVPLTVIRGVANLAGERDRARWQVEAALAAARQILLDALTDTAHPTAPTEP